MSTLHEEIITSKENDDEMTDFDQAQLKDQKKNIETEIIVNKNQELLGETTHEQNQLS